MYVTWILKKKNTYIISFLKNISIKLKCALEI